MAATNRLVQLLRDPRATDADCQELVEGVTDMGVLDLSGRRLGLHGARKLVRILKGMTGLTSLGLSGSLCGFRGESADAFQPFPSFLKTEGGAEALAEALGGMTKLSSLDLSRNGMGDQSLGPLVEVLGRMTGLTSLNLSYNSLHKRESAMALAGALKSMTGLVMLRLDGSCIGVDGDQVMAVCAALKGITGLTGLDLRGLAITSKSMGFWVDALGFMTGLLELNLRSNFRSWGDGEATAMCTVLKGMTGLTVLDLGRCFRESKCLNALLEALSCMTSLTVLRLGHNSFEGNDSDADFRAMGGVLKRMTGLTELSLEYYGSGDNPIGNKGAMALAEALWGVTGLTNLNLLGCRISGAKENKAVRKAIQMMTGLTVLNLIDSGIEVGGATAMTEVLEHATGLKVLHLVNTRLGGAEIEAVVSALDGMRDLPCWT